MIRQYGLLFALCALLPWSAAAAIRPSSDLCAAQAIEQAKKLLAFHSGNDDRAEVSGRATPLPSIANPANPKQRFDVLEVLGYIYKGEYRMRFEYFRLRDGGCVLMGQEILEHANL
jgi:hypothetical protein